MNQTIKQTNNQSVKTIKQINNNKYHKRHLLFFVFFSLSLSHTKPNKAHSITSLHRSNRILKATNLDSSSTLRLPFAIYLPIYKSINLSIHLSIHSSIKTKSHLSQQKPFPPVCSQTLFTDWPFARAPYYPQRCTDGSPTASNTLSHRTLWGSSKLYSTEKTRAKYSRSSRSALKTRHRSR